MAVRTVVKVCMRVSRSGRPCAFSASEAIELSTPAGQYRHIAMAAYPASRHTSPKRITAIGTPSGISMRQAGKPITHIHRSERMNAALKRSASSAIRENAGNRT